MSSHQRVLLSHSNWFETCKESILLGWVNYTWHRCVCKSQQKSVSLLTKSCRNTSSIESPKHCGKSKGRWLNQWVSSMYRKRVTHRITHFHYCTPQPIGLFRFWCFCIRCGWTASFGSSGAGARGHSLIAWNVLEASAGSTLCWEKWTRSMRIRYTCKHIHHNHAHMY